MITVEAIRSRRSVREYSEKDVSEAALFELLEAARWAPSAHNAQPWRFIIVRDDALKKKLAKEMAIEWEKDLKKDKSSRGERERLVDDSISQFSGAPVIIVPCLTMEDMCEYQDRRRKKAEYVMGVQSVAAAIENLLLVAHSMGLATCWFCAPLFCPKTVREVLNTSENLEPQAIVTLGYPNENPKPPPRKPVEQIMIEIGGLRR